MAVAEQIRTRHSHHDGDKTAERPRVVEMPGHCEQGMTRRSPPQYLQQSAYRLHRPPDAYSHHGDVGEHLTKISAGPIHT